jgi:hypothetical protein
MARSSGPLASRARPRRRMAKLPRRVSTRRSEVDARFTIACASRTALAAARADGPNRAMTLQSACAWTTLRRRERTKSTALRDQDRRRRSFLNGDDFDRLCEWHRDIPIVGRNGRSCLGDTRLLPAPLGFARTGKHWSGGRNGSPSLCRIRDRMS